MNGNTPPVSENRVLAAIDTITAETGYPPNAEELAAALNATTKQVHSALIQAKRRGRIRYDEDERFVAGVSV